jgi:hypothetical protein
MGVGGGGMGSWGLQPRISGPALWEVGGGVRGWGGACGRDRASAPRSGCQRRLPAPGCRFLSPRPGRALPQTLNPESARRQTHPPQARRDRPRQGGPRARRAGAGRHPHPRQRRGLCAGARQARLLNGAPLHERVHKPETALAAPAAAALRRRACARAWGRAETRLPPAGRAPRGGRPRPAPPRSHRLPVHPSAAPRRALPPRRRYKGVRATRPPPDERTASLLEAQAASFK